MIIHVERPDPLWAAPFLDGSRLSRSQTPSQQAAFLSTAPFFIDGL